MSTATLYLWKLSAVRWANPYYAAAVQAGTQSWKALLFGSLDAGNAVTVDKPPVSLWVMTLSARVFGFSTWSMLVPQALGGVAAIGVLYATVRRWSGPVAGLLAGLALAVTPVAALIFRYNQPDALLTLLLVAAAYCLTRAVDGAPSRAGTRWLLLAGMSVGFAFLTKMFQALLVVPALAVVYLVCAPTSLRRRIGQSLAASAALVFSTGWYVALVELWPPDSRPYIGGSTTNSLLQLAFGYNGVVRLTGGGGGVAGIPSSSVASALGGEAGLTRLLRSNMGIQVSWLLPAALIGAVLGLWVTRQAPRTDRTRAALLLWGGWLLVTGLVFSYMSGVIHPYYTIALAPSVVALITVSGHELWLLRETWVGRLGLAAMVATAGGWGYLVLAHNAGWYPALRYAILASSAVAAGILLMPPRRLARTAVVLAVGIIAGLAGPTAYALATAATPPRPGSPPAAGPRSATTAMSDLGGTPHDCLNAPSQALPSSELTDLLAATTTRWAAAVNGARTAARLELASGTSVIAIGGYTCADPTPTLTQFRSWVAYGLVRYYVTGNVHDVMAGADPNDNSNQIATWIKENYTAKVIASTIVYDLSSPKG